MPPELTLAAATTSWTVGVAVLRGIALRSLHTNVDWDQSRIALAIRYATNAGFVFWSLPPFIGAFMPAVIPVAPPPPPPPLPPPPPSCFPTRCMLSTAPRLSVRTSTMTIVVVWWFACAAATAASSASVNVIAVPAAWLLASGLAKVTIPAVARRCRRATVTLATVFASLFAPEPITIVSPTLMPAVSATRIVVAPAATSSIDSVTEACLPALALEPPPPCPSIFFAAAE